MSRRQALFALGWLALVPGCVRMKPSTKQLSGVFPIMATPYSNTKAIDYDDLAREVDFLNRCGVPGMAWPQLAGDTFKLSPEERKRGMEVIAKAGRGGKAAIVLGVDGPNIKAAMAYLEHAEAQNPDAYIALPPYDAKSLEEVLDYYRTLARATTKPLFVQNSNMRNGIKPNIEALVQLAQEVPNAAYFKEEIPPALERTRELCNHRATVKKVFSGGGGRTLMEEMRFGVDGVMAGNAYADVFVLIWDLYHAGQEAKAHELHLKLISLLDLEKSFPLTRRYFMKRRGVFSTLVSRDDQVDLIPEAIREIESKFTALQPYLKT